MLAFLNSALGGTLLTYRLQGWRVYVQTSSDLNQLNMMENVETIVRHYLPATHLSFNKKQHRLTIYCSKNRTPGQPSRRRRRSGSRSPLPSNPAQRPEQSSDTTYTAPTPPPLSDEEAALRAAVGEAPEERKNPDGG